MFGMSALAHQVNMNNFLSLLVGASLVAANSSPSHHDLTSFSQPSQDFSNGVSSFALPAEDGRMAAFDSYTLAFLNYTYTNGDDALVQDGELIGKFGEGRILNRTGLLVHITKSDNENDHTGCTKDWNGTLGTPLPPREVPWIALIKRGNCNFEEKVRHAYNHGAGAVIIYNDKDDPRLDKMKINDKERNITAVFTTKAKGHELIDIMERMGYKVTMAIIEGNRHFKSMANINRTSVLFVSISFIVLMIISLVWLVFYYVQRFRYLQTKDKQSRRLCNVAKRIIAKIPTKSIKSDDKELEIDNDCCAICIEPYKVTDVIRVLPCKHEFHKACIDPWLLEHRTCPMCKMDILKHYGFVFTGSQESILQLDLDMEEGDLIDDHSSTDGGGYQRRHSVSPLPQIRASSENRMSRSSSESDSENERHRHHHHHHHHVATSNHVHHHHHHHSRGQSLGGGRNSCHGESSVDYVDEQQHQQHDVDVQDSAAAESRTENDICVGCLAAALNKKQRKFDGTCSQDDADSDTFSPEHQHGSNSLPATLKKYKGNHSTGSCRGMNPPDHYHQHPAPSQQQPASSSKPFNFYKTDGGQIRKVRTPLKNLLSQSVSAPCDDDCSLTNIHLGTEQHEPCSDPPAGMLAEVAAPASGGRRCSLSRTSSCDSTDRRRSHLQQEEEDDDEGSDETEPHSDNDLIAKGGAGHDGEGKKK